MNIKLEKALARLQGILPLKERQEECSEQIKTLHQHMLHSFVSRGRILTRKEMTQYVSNLEEAILSLRNSDMVIFSDNGDPLGAYPFTMEVREHIVQVNGHQVYAMCALDALAISPMFGVKTQISSQCRITGDAFRIQMSGKTIENLHEASNIHIGIAWGATDADTSCADSLCMEMMFLRDSKVTQQWLMDNSANREAFTLLEAVEFSSRFFVPLIG